MWVAVVAGSIETIRRTNHGEPIASPLYAQPREIFAFGALLPKGVVGVELQELVCSAQSELFFWLAGRRGKIPCGAKFPGIIIIPTTPVVFWGAHA